VKRDYLDHAMRDTRCIELRHQIGDRWTSGLFNDLNALRMAINDLKGQGNLYSTINAPLQQTAPNVMGVAAALRDQDMAFHTRLPFDFDPVRGSGQPSRDDELAVAVKQRDAFVTAMKSLGFPSPALGMSGNGAHALYRCRLPVSSESAEMLRAMYKGLQREFSTDQVQFDPTVRNPARILRLYGTVNRKGTATPDTPHRLSSISIPDRWGGVSPRLIEQLANRYAKQPVTSVPVARSIGAPPGGNGDFSTLNVEAWFAAYGLYKRALGGGKHAVTCPWANEHSTADTAYGTDTVVWDGGRPALWPTFRCLHAHCDGRGIADVMQLLGDADRYCLQRWRGRGLAGVLA
jgi:hypothetical protein